MFDFLKSAPFIDLQLGTLTKKGSYWRGSISIEDSTVAPLQLSGSRKIPDAMCVDLARHFTANFKELKKQIEPALFDHYQPYQESVSQDASFDDLEPCPLIACAQGVWPYVSPVYVRIQSLSGSPEPSPIVEIAFAVAWDEEHTVGARIQDWCLFELCGSVI